MEVYEIDNSWNKNYEIISSSDELTQGRCFACSECNNCMAGKEVVQQNGKTYCWKCYESFFGLKCVSCLKLMAGLSHMTFIYFNNQVWHKECFYCSSCGISLEGRAFQQEGKFTYCQRCVCIKSRIFSFCSKI